MKDPQAFTRVIEVARMAGDDALDRLWLCHHKWQQVAAWRAQCPAVRLVDSTFVGRMHDGAEHRAAALAEAGVDAVNLHHSEWNGGLTALFHRFGVLCFGDFPIASSTSFTKKTSWSTASSMAIEIQIVGSADTTHDPFQRTVRCGARS